MGIKDFFKGKEAYTTGERELILVLMAIRIAAGMQANGMSQAEAQSEAMNLLRATDLSGDRILQSPDAMIVKIFKDYIKIISDNLALAKQQKVHVEMERIKAFALTTIDEHRDKLLSLPKGHSVPDNLHGFILYRVRRETEVVSGNDVERLGFSEATVRSMTELVKAAYQPTISFNI